MPESPRKKCRVIEKLLESPKVNKELKRKGVVVTKADRKEIYMNTILLKSVNIADLKPTKGGTQQVKKTAYKNVLQCVLDKRISKYHKFGNAISAYLNIRQPRGKVADRVKDWWQSAPRKKRSDSTPESTKEKIQSFFLSLEISREVPHKKDIKSHKGNKAQTHIMTMTLSDAYDAFKMKYPSIKVGLTTFKKLKPFNVKRVSETSHRSCLCQICCNLALKVDGLQKYAEKEDDSLKQKIKGMNKNTLSDISVCPYDEYPQPLCLERTCSNCGPQKVTEFIGIAALENDIEWYKWEPIQITTNDNLKKRVTSCVVKSTTVDSFLKELENDMQKYPGHIYRAK